MTQKIFAFLFVLWLGVNAFGYLTFYRCAKDGRAYFAGEYITCSMEKKE